jgi:hypothetical protein
MAAPVTGCRRVEKEIGNQEYGAFQVPNPNVSSAVLQKVWDAR